MKRVIEYTSAVLLGLALLLGLAVLVGPRLGWQIDKVMSGSMDPAVKVGGAVVSQKVDPETIETGDIITYYSPTHGRLTTHRVVEIESQGPLRFQTKGDANEDPDPYVVGADRVAGKVRFHIPYIGYPAQFAKTPLGFFTMIAIPGLIIIVLEMRGVWIELSEDEKRKKAKATAPVEARGEEQ